MSLQAVLFDVGNTLVQEHKDWRSIEHRGVARLVETMSGHGLNLRSEDFSRVLLGIREENFRKAVETGEEVTAVQSIGQALQEVGAGQVSTELLNRGEEAYFHPEEEESELLPGVAESLRMLHYRGYQLGVISNATTGLVVRRILELHGILHWFRTVVISAEVGHRKPRPEIFKLTLSTLGVKAKEAVYVGDRPEVDIVGAKAAGIRTILLKITEQEELVEGEMQPDYLAHSFPEAVEGVKKLSGVAR